jgi:hypothetical protein
MKQGIMAVALLYAVLFSISGQEEKDRSFSFQINPAVYLSDLIMLGTDDNPETYWAVIEFEFQYALTNYFILSCAAQFSSAQYMNAGYLYVNYIQKIYIKQWQLLLTPGIIYNPLGKKLKGMLVGLYPVMGWTNISATAAGIYGDYYEAYTGTNDNFTLLGIEILTRYQWIFNNGFTFALGAGRNIWKIESLFKMPFDISMHLRLGYSF